MRSLTTICLSKRQFLRKKKCEKTKRHNFRCGFPLASRDTCPAVWDVSRGLDSREWPGSVKRWVASVCVPPFFVFSRFSPVPGTTSRVTVFRDFAGVPISFGTSLFPLPSTLPLPPPQTVPQLFTRTIKNKAKSRKPKEQTLGRGDSLGQRRIRLKLMNTTERPHRNKEIGWKATRTRGALQRWYRKQMRAILHKLHSLDQTRRATETHTDTLTRARKRKEREGSHPDKLLRL